MMMRDAHLDVKKLDALSLNMDFPSLPVVPQTEDYQLRDPWAVLASA
jgi:hypothetical protein